MIYALKLSFSEVLQNNGVLFEGIVSINGSVLTGVVMIYLFYLVPNMCLKLDYLLEIFLFQVHDGLINFKVMSQIHVVGVFHLFHAPKTNVFINQTSYIHCKLIIQV